MRSPAPTEALERATPNQSESASELAQIGRCALELSDKIGAGQADPNEAEIKRLKSETTLLKAKHAHAEASGAAAASLVCDASVAPGAP